MHSSAPIPGWNMGMCVSVTVLSYRNVFKRDVSVSRVTSTTLRQLGQDGRRPTGELCHMTKDRSAQGEDSILPSPYTARGHTFSATCWNWFIEQCVILLAIIFVSESCLGYIHSDINAIVQNLSLSLHH